MGWFGNAVNWAGDHGLLGPVGYAATGGFGNPLDWGKKQTDPSKAVLGDGDYMRDYIRQQLGGVGGRQAPSAGNAAQMTAARINPSLQGQWRGDQRTLAQQLFGVASGQQAGAGELAVNRQRQAGLGQQLAAAAAQRGGMAGLAGRSAARNMGTLSTNSAGMAREAALGDQTAARGLLAGVLGQGREQDMGLATSQAGLEQQAGLANQQARNQFSLADQAAKLQQMGMNDQQMAQLLGQMYGISAAEMQARLAQEAADMGQSGIFGDLLQAGGTLGAAAITMSDRAAKADVRDGAAAVDEFLDTIQPALYRYLDVADGEGVRAGIMAQDAEQSDVGRDFVIETERGKALDNAKVISVLLASVARLNQRVRALEGNG